MKTKANAWRRSSRSRWLQNFYILNLNLEYCSGYYLKKWSARFLSMLGCVGKAILVYIGHFNVQMKFTFFVSCIVFCFFAIQVLMHWWIFFVACVLMVVKHSLGTSKYCVCSCLWSIVLTHEEVTLINSISVCGLWYSCRFMKTLTKRPMWGKFDMWRLSYL